MQQRVRQTFKLFSLLLISILSTQSVSAQLNSIILGRPTDTSMTASIMFDQNADFYLQFGSQSGVYTDSTSVVSCNAGTPFFAVMRNLTANTKYYYRAKYRTSGGGAFTASPEYSYHTQRSAGSTFTFTIESDEHLYDYGSPALFQVAGANVAQDNPDFMISLGDFFGDDHYPFTITSHQVDSLRKVYRPRLGAVYNSIPFFICQGNHDGEKMYYLDTLAPNNLGTWATLWRKFYYANPEPNGFYSGNTVPEGNGIGLPDDYYAYTWGNALFVVLDAYRFDCDSAGDINAKPNGWNWTLGQTQYNWLHSTLQNSTAKFKFVFIHHPLGEDRGGIVPAQYFEWGGKERNGNNTFATHRPGWAMPIHDLFKTYGVNILFQGHDHVFAHEIMDSVTYQEVPMMADATYIKGMVNSAAYTADTFENSGYVRVTVSPSCVKVDYVKNYLPQDTTSGVNHNKEVKFSYTIGTCDTTSVHTGIAEIAGSEMVKVFPNPAKDRLSVLFTDNPKNYMIKMEDALGKVLLQTNYNSIDVSAVPDGIYFLGIETEKYTTVKKIVISH
jgi:Secretion system C-terminal sorting domain/Calcineurin-like phosphoesterase